MLDPHRACLSMGMCQRHTIMTFDQGEFNFDAKGSEEGFRRWREELDAKKRAFETTWGVILSRRVSVKLKDLSKPVLGLLEWTTPPRGDPKAPPVFKIRKLEFSPGEIESIVQVVEDESC
jgi:hypothetical protein